MLFAVCTVGAQSLFVLPYMMHHETDSNPSVVSDSITLLIVLDYANIDAVICALSQTNYLLSDPYSKSVSAVRVELSNLFKVTVGVKQGCDLLPYLFNLLLEAMMKEALNINRCICRNQWSEIDR